jgi:phosphatidylinositol alpha-1,6-mannosyltransferase
VHVIPNGVDTALFAPGALATHLGLGNLPTIGFVGEARLKKGLGTLLLAFERLASIQPVQLLLVGGVRDDDADVLHVFQRQQPGLPLRVVPHTPHEQLPAIYGLLDVLVLPSRRDGLPNALLEGMACARPIVASAVGGILDVITDGHDGLLTPPDDVDALTDALLSLLRSPDRRRALGEAARQTVQSCFTLENEVEQNVEIYGRLVGSSS